MIKICWSRFIFIAFAAVYLMSCAPQIGQTVLSNPDEYSRVYEAEEEFILKAIAGVFKERTLGSDVRIDSGRKTVETDYIVQSDFRMKSLARVERLSGSENEVFLSVVTERRTEKGWEQRRYLDKGQYTIILDKIELKIYEEMYKF